MIHLDKIMDRIDLNVHLMAEAGAYKVLCKVLDLENKNEEELSQETVCLNGLL